MEQWRTKERFFIIQNQKYRTLSKKDKIRKNQIDTQWQYAKAETEIHCKKFLQIFIILMTTGFAIIVTSITEDFKPLQNWIVIGSVFIILAWYSIFKINKLTKKLKRRLVEINDKLEKLK